MLGLPFAIGGVGVRIANKKEKLITGLLLVALVGAFWIFKIPCLIKLATGIPCPGCGMTRAYVNLFSLNIAAAFRLHPMFWSVPILALYYLTDGQLFKNKVINYGLLALIGLGFLTNWIFQLI